MIKDKICPFCNKSVSYWPKCSYSIKYEVGYSTFGRGKGAIKQFFHESCFKNYVKKGDSK